MWIANQRVVSRTEPEIGIGAVKSVKLGEWVEIYFPLIGEVRKYGHFGAPIQRLLLREGQDFYLKNGTSSQIISVDDEDGIMVYETELGRFRETDMDHRLHDVGAIEAFLQGHLGEHATYELRREAWDIKRRYQSSEALGLVGPRVQPIAHQLYVAKEVIARPRPRVLLAD